MEEQEIWSLMARKLSNSATNQELVTLQQYMSRDPSLQYQYEMLAQYWQQQEPDADEATMLRRYLKLRRRLEQLGNAPEAAPVVPVRLPWWQQYRMTTGWAAAILLAVGITTWWQINHNNNATALPSEVVTRNGSKTRVALPDGTAVWLNGGSRLTYDHHTFETDKREVTLEGEAYFDVAPRPGHPFLVHTGGMDIQVLGTTFNVKAYASGRVAEATLLSGAIAVVLHDPAASRILLKPNQKLVLRNNNNSTANVPAAEATYTVTKPNILEHDSTMVETAWLENRMAFQSATFADVAADMERWYNVKINFTDNSLRNIVLTGSFGTETLEQALQALQLTAPFKYRIEKEEVYIDRP